MKKILSLLTLLSFAMPIFAEDWQPFGSVYVDNMSVTRTENSVKAWIIHPDFVKSKVNNRKYTYEAAYFDARCTDRELAILNTAWYDRYHQLVTNKIENVDYIKIKPKTNNEIIFKALCSQRRIL